MRADISRLKLIIDPIAKHYGLEAVYLFGSQARNTADNHSDYDFYIKKGRLRGMFQLSGLFQDLEKALNRQVDIVLEPEGGACLDDYLLKSIETDGILLYGN